MKLLIIIIMVCGQPDTVAIVEQDQPPYMYHSEDLRTNPILQKDLHDKLHREDGTVIVFPDERGICT